MQFFRQSDADDAMVVSWGIRVMLLRPACGMQGDQTAVGIAGLGGCVEIQDDAGVALESLVRAGGGFGLLVVDCEALGGLTAAQSWLALLQKHGVALPVILLVSRSVRQEFPNEKGLPVVLRAPVSSVSLRVGFQHALRDRLAS
jgi:hypothetical protein